MAFDYTAIPTTAALADLLGDVGLSALATSVSADLQAGYLAEAQEEFEKAARRQFVPGSEGEVRYYDGSGTGRLEIDEYIDVMAVAFVQLPTVASVDVTGFVEVEQRGTPKTVLQIYQGPTNLVTTYYPKFPEGRSNVKVTGQFGYAASIPKPVWFAMLRKAAAKMVDTYILSEADGLPAKKWAEADRSEEYDLGRLASDVVGWQKSFDEAVKMYRRPTGAARRRMTPPLY